MSLIEEESDDELDEGNDWTPVSQRDLTLDPSEVPLTGLNGPEYTQVMTLKQMYSDPKRRRTFDSPLARIFHVPLR